MQRSIRWHAVPRFAGAAVLLALLSPAALADQPGQNGAPGMQTSANQSPDAVDIFIGELEKRIIRDYYERHVYEWEQSPEGRDYKKHKNKHKGLPPGLAKKGSLPPGLAKQLARNGHLPPGLEKKMHPVPEELCRRLPPPPPDCVRGYYGGHVIFYNPRTSVIFNVFAGITISR